MKAHTPQGRGMMNMWGEFTKSPLTPLTKAGLDEDLPCGLTRRLIDFILVTMTCFSSGFHFFQPLCYSEKKSFLEICEMK